MLKRMNFEYNGITIDIPLHGCVTMIDGESGDGKTFVFNALQAMNKNIMFKFTCINYRNFNVCRAKLDPEMLYVIDDVDTLLVRYPEFRDVINSWEYQFLLLGHGFNGIKGDMRYYGCLELEDRILRFEPYFHFSFDKILDNPAEALKQGYHLPVGYKERHPELFKNES